MDGPFHYSEAERLLGALSKVVLLNDGSSPEATLMLAEANVHATLALAMATAFRPGGEDSITEDAWKGWAVAAGIRDPALDEPSQVEPAPAAQVRLDELVLNDLVIYPDWNDGKPVRFVGVRGTVKSGFVVVMYEDPGLLGPIFSSDELPVDTLVTPYGGA